MNPQNKKQIIIVVALAVVLLGVLVFQLTRGAKPPDMPTSTTALPGGAAATPSALGKVAMGQPIELKTVAIDPDTLLKDIEVVPFDYQANRIERDPMTPLIGIIRAGEAMKAVVPGTPQDVLQKKVTGIIWDKYNPMAVVDDEVVGLGHAYPNGVQVYSIERDRVVFKVRDSLIPVPMKEL
ncbi:MAG TPA: hypothetical protein PLI09_23130 [Candidatus Hydrogenedentes bacterium]|nr:hypothetical protein [Candidatus Hydrogenedentota bacterium]